MRAIVVFALFAGTLVSVPAFAQSAEPDVKAGKAVFEKWCKPCHGDGRFRAGTDALRTKYKNEKPAVLEERTDLTAPLVKATVRGGAGLMAPFRKTEITDAELETLAAYLSRTTPR